MKKINQRTFFAAILVLLFQGLSSANLVNNNLTESRNGMVSTGSTYATEAGVLILESGGNAVDAAAAACFALMVTDPANTSLGGRTQILLHLRNGKLVAIDGATQAPAGVPPLKSPDEDRTGYLKVPIPGAPAALADMVRKYGKLNLRDALQPAIELAEKGFTVPERLAATWERTRTELAKNPGAAENFLKPDGSAYKTGEIFRQPRLAKLLHLLADSEIDSFYKGQTADLIVNDVSHNGGFITTADLKNYRAQNGKLVNTDYRGYKVVSAGGRAWGNTLSEMLNILENFPVGRTEPTSEEVEVLARVIAQSLEDRPQQLGTLKPKPDGYSLSMISTKKFAAVRAAMIREQMKSIEKGSPQGQSQFDDQGDTTHLSVMDMDGNAVSLTTSIGPSFGSRVATPELGFLYAHSYRMRSDPTPKARDLTEMTPTIVIHNGRPILSIGGAGSERIPSAILQVLSNILDRGWSLESAMKAPRLSAIGTRVRMQYGFPDQLIKVLKSRGFEIEMIEEGAARHAGLVHAVRYDSKTGTFFGAADLWDSGAAEGPILNRKARREAQSF